VNFPHKQGENIKFMLLGAALLNIEQMGPADISTASYCVYVGVLCG